MSISLNLEGLLPVVDSDKKEEQAASTSRHISSRKPIGLNFSNANKPQATALTYWLRYKLATPLFWCIYDSLAVQKDTKNRSKILQVEEVFEAITPQAYAKKLLTELRKAK